MRHSTLGTGLSSSSLLSFIMKFSILNASVIPAACSGNCIHLSLCLLSCIFAPSQCFTLALVSMTTMQCTHRMELLSDVLCWMDAHRLPRWRDSWARRCSRMAYCGASEKRIDIWEQGMSYERPAVGPERDCSTSILHWMFLCRLCVHEHSVFVIFQFISVRV